MQSSAVLAIVVPYYQRESGVLQKAVRSVIAQHDCALALHILIVDDESPAPAAPEIAALEIPAHIGLTVIRQVNAGPGAARNTAIANAPTGTRYIAFLDSDDEWTPHHLKRAVCALEMGYDFYFANHLQLGGTLPAFERAGRIAPEQHGVIGQPEKNLHEYRGDMFHQILTANVVGTSTVVYRFERFTDQRFRVQFRAAGEDYLFWMELARAGAKPAFSSEVEANYGRGVNIYARSGWGTDGFCQRLHDEIQFKKFTIRFFGLTQELAAKQKEAILTLRNSFLSDILHRILHRKPLNWGVIQKQVLHDPLTFIRLPIVLMNMVRRKPG